MLIYYRLNAKRPQNLRRSSPKHLLSHAHADAAPAACTESVVIAGVIFGVGVGVEVHVGGGRRLGGWALEVAVGVI